MQVTQLIWVSEKLHLHYLLVFGGRIWLWTLSILSLDVNCANTLKTSTNVLLVCCNHCLFQMANSTHVLLISWLICLRLMGTMHWWLLLTSLASWAGWYPAGRGMVSSHHCKLQSCFSTIGLDSLVYRGMLWPQCTFYCSLLEGLTEFTWYANNVQ